MFVTVGLEEAQVLSVANTPRDSMEGARGIVRKSGSLGIPAQSRDGNLKVPHDLKQYAIHGTR